MLSNQITQIADRRGQEGQEGQMQRGGERAWPRRHRGSRTCATRVRWPCWREAQSRSPAVSNGLQAQLCAAKEKISRSMASRFFFGCCLSVLAYPLLVRCASRSGLSATERGIATARRNQTAIWPTSFLFCSLTHKKLDFGFYRSSALFDAF